MIGLERMELVTENLRCQNSPEGGRKSLKNHPQYRRYWKWQRSNER